MDVTEIIRAGQIRYTLIAVATLFILTVLAITINRLRKKAVDSSVLPQVQQEPESETEESRGALWKTLIFAGMVSVLVANTVYLAGSTLYINFKSVTSGPIHWHADFEIWNCGVEIELLDPVPPSNKVGSPLLHEHNDKEIHVEEAVYNWQDITLGAFFRVTGGELRSDYLKIPTNAGVVEMRNGQLCPDGRPALLQVFLYKYQKDGSVSQAKLSDPENYILSPEQKVPPGDCLILEFSPEIKNQTDKLCLSHEVERRKNGR